MEAGMVAGTTLGIVHGTIQAGTTHGTGAAAGDGMTHGTIHTITDGTEHGTYTGDTITIPDMGQGISQAPYTRRTHGRGKDIRPVRNEYLPAAHHSEAE